MAGTGFAWVVAIASCATALGLAIGTAVATDQVDIGVYLAGGSHLFGGGLYSMHVPPSGLLFTYPPFAALAFVPLAYLPLTAARVIWAVVNTAALTGLAGVSLRAARPADAPAASWWAALLLTGPATLLNPVFVNFSLGQVNLVLALLVTADLLLPRRPRHAPPQGVLCGIAAAIKLTPLILVPYLFLVGRRRAAAWAAGSFVLCEALAALASPASSWTYWTKDVFDASRAGGLLYISDQNLQSVVERFHHATVGDAVVLPAAASIGILGLLLATAACRRSSPLLGLLVIETTSLVVSPITWVHHLVWVVPAIVWMAVAPDRPAAGPLLAAGTALLFWAAPIWWVPNQHLRELREDAWQLVAGNSFFFALVAFLAGVGLLLLRRRRLPAEAPSPSPS